MASLINCITEALASGRITKDVAEEIKEYAARLEAAGFSIDDAAKSAIENGKQDALIRRWHTALQVIKETERIADAKNHPDNIAVGTASLIGRDVRNKARYTNVEREARGLLKVWYSGIADAIGALRVKGFGLSQDVNLTRNIMREMHGQTTGDARAAKFSKQIGDLAEQARITFNKHGGLIPKNENWGWSHAHESRLVRKASQQEWVDFVMPRLNRQKMIDHHGVPLADNEITELLGKTYTSIKTDGLADLTPGARSGKKLANRRQESRFLVFKDGDAWIEYHERFGRRDMFSAIFNHFERMAHDIALLKQFGPNPEHTYHVLRDMIRKADAADELAVTEKIGGLSHLDSLWDVATGKMEEGHSLRIAEVGQAIRDWNVATTLGSAAITSLGDIGFLQVTSRWLGMSSTRALSNYFKFLATLPGKEREIQAVRMGLGAEMLMGRGVAARRFSDFIGSGISAQVADTTLRATGLNKVTNSARLAFGWEFYTQVGEMVGRPLSQIDQAFRQALERFGVDDAVWSELGKTPLIEYSGVRVFSIESLMKRTDLDEAAKIDLATKLTGMESELRLFASPDMDLRARAAIRQTGAVSGTLSGELMRNILQFKGFPITAVMLHVNRGIYEAGALNKAKYLAHLTIASTVMGMVSLQMSEVAKGREPMDMDNWKAWAHAFVKGGGLGIYGDFLYSGLFDKSQNRPTVTEAALGPVVGGTVNLFGNFGEALDGKDTNFAVELTRFGTRNTPFLSSAWYTRLAFERLITDQLRLAADPKQASSMRRQETKRRKEFGQEFWWRPGEMTPE